MEKIFREFKETSRAAKEKIVTLILAGFGLVAALAWNDAIQSLFKFFFPEAQELVGKFIYAVFVTLVVVVVSIQLQKIAEKNGDNR